MMTLLTAKEKEEMIAEAIKRISDGEVITVSDSSYSALGLCIGDFRSVGWSERVATRRSLYYNWTGPAPIIVGSTMVQPGGCTEETDMDWS